MDRTVLFDRHSYQFADCCFYTVFGALLPIPPAFLPGIDAGTLNMGLMGYNGVLCSIALGNKNLKSLVWTSCSVLLSVVLQVIGMNLGITTLTAPFVYQYG